METNKKTTSSTAYKRFRNMVLFLTGMATGFSFCHLFSNVHHNNAGKGTAVVALPVAKDPALLQKEVVASEKATAKQLALAEQNNSRLKNRLRQSESALKDAKEKGYRLQVRLYQSLEQPDSLPSDSTVAFAPSGNVVEMLDTLVAVGAEKDLLHDSIVQDLKSQVENRDTVISVQDSHIALLRHGFDLSIASQKLLTEENMRLGKKIKRQRFAGKVKSAGLLILSGLALKSLIHR